VYPTFKGEVRSGRLVIDELSDRSDQMLSGKNVAVVVLDDEVNGTGDVRSGYYESGTVEWLGEFEGKQTLVIIQHDMLGSGSADAFDQKFQLGAKIGDLDT
jgi:hypothetical protein